MLVLLGYPLGHSISPVFQQAALDYYSLPVEYRAMPTPPNQLGKVVNELRNQGYLGANVTIPHKEAVCDHLDEVDSLATSIGAVNTIVKDGSRLTGHNTDVHGFVASLKKKAGFELKDSSVLLVGSGGASRAAVFGLAQENVRSLTIVNRTLARAQSLAAEVSGVIGTVKALALQDPAFAESARNSDLIVNSTSIGMRSGGAEGQSPVDVAMIRPGTLVYDMVYSPEETPMLVTAKEAGAHTLGGLWMLVLQGAAAFEMWTGKPAPVEVMYCAAKKAQAAQ